MVKGTASVHIDRPADEVFAYVAEAENNPRWHAHVLETRWLDDGPMRVGRRARQVSRIIGLRYEIEAEIALWEPPRHVVWQTVTGGATVRTDCRIESEGGGCRLTMSAEGEFANGLLRVLSPLSVPALRRSSRNDLRRLARVMDEAATTLDRT